MIPQHVSRSRLVQQRNETSVLGAFFCRDATTLNCTNHFFEHSDAIKFDNAYRGLVCLRKTARTNVSAISIDAQTLS